MINHAGNDVTFKDFGYLSIDALKLACGGVPRLMCMLAIRAAFFVKLIELIAVGRPVIAVPDESEEAKTSWKRWAEL